MTATPDTDQPVDPSGVCSGWWDDRSGWSSWFTLDGQKARIDSTVNVVAPLRDHLTLTAAEVVLPAGSMSCAVRRRHGCNALAVTGSFR